MSFGDKIEPIFFCIDLCISLSAEEQGEVREEDIKNWVCRYEMIQQINGLGGSVGGEHCWDFLCMPAFGIVKAGPHLMFGSQLGIMRMPHSLILFSLPADEVIHPPGAKLAPLTYVQAAWRRWLRQTHVWLAKPRPSGYECKYGWAGEENKTDILNSLGRNGCVRKGSRRTGANIQQHFPLQFYPPIKRKASRRTCLRRKTADEEAPDQRLSIHNTSAFTAGCSFSELS